MSTWQRAAAVLCAWAVASGGVCAAGEPSAGQGQATQSGIAAQITAEKLALDIHETIERLPVSLVLPNGKPYVGEMVVTHYRPAGDGPFPVVVFSHGRSAQTRHDPARWRGVMMARYWVRRGFAVLVPTRVGYGSLGQHVDPEAAGPCDRADFQPALEAIATQVDATVRYARTKPWIDGTRVVLAGVSYGGFGTIAASARDIPGVVGAINFVGGVGGNPAARPGEPCQGLRIEALARKAGGRARAPMLWLYAENDRYWGADWPRRWHAAFTRAGGVAAFKQFAAFGEDGHKLMSTGFALWRPVVDAYLTERGFAMPRVLADLPATGFADIGDTERVPHVKASVRAEGYAKFLAADLPRAFALSPSGAWGWRSGPDAVEVALARCRSGSRTPCALYAVDDRVVWKGHEPSQGGRP